MVDTDVVDVFVCDDETAVRVSLKLFLSRYQWMDVVGAAATPEECVDQVRSLRPRVATVDIFMRSKSDGLRTCQQIASVSPETSVVAYSAFFDQSLAMSLRGFGVRSFVDKGSEMIALVEGVQAAVDGHSYLCPSLTVRAARWSLFETQTAGSRIELSPAQYPILQLIAKGQTSGEISAQLNVELSTVRTQRRRIMQKFGVHNVAQLLDVATTQGFL